MAGQVVLSPAAASGCRLSLPGGSKWMSALPTCLPGGRKNAGGREIIIDN